MKHAANTIEDLLEILAGLQDQAKIQIESNDATIMHSIARQVFRGTAMTDRQYTLMKEKLQTYKVQFTALEYDFDRAVETLRKPLREIDRSKYVKIVDYPANLINLSDDKGKFLEVRFPFSKKLITKINKINSVRGYYHEKGSHTHYFKFNEKNVQNVVEEFKDQNFNFAEEIIEYYNKIKNIIEQKNIFVPSITDFKFINVDDVVVELAEKEIGILNKENLIKYIDRRKRYGIVDFDQTNLTGNLSQKIALRENREMLFKPNEYRINEILESLENLDRYPIIFVLDNKPHEQLYSIFNFYKNFLPSEQQSVLFRLDSDTGKEFNELVRDCNLNNWVDNNTKIVYINNDKLSKVLFKTDWKPITAFSFNSRLNPIVNSYINDNCDLTIFYEDEISPFRRYSKYYG